MKPLCIICGTESGLLLNKDLYDIYECPKCKLSFVYPQPPQSFLKDEVYSEKSGYQGNKAKDLSKLVPLKKQQNIIDFLKKEPRGKFLDIGCSSGDLMYFLQKLGFDVCGVELNPKTGGIGIANGLNVKLGTLESAHFGENTFDFIHMGDLIEHVSDPVALIKETKRIMKPGGQLIIVTPNMECFWAKTTRFLFDTVKIPWGVITPPHHLYQFSLSNLQKLLIDNNFSVIKTWYKGTPPLKYELGSLHLLKRWKNDRTIGNLLYMAFVFFIYTVIFAINRIVELFPVKRFSMVVISRLNK